MTDLTPVREPWLRETAQVLAALPVFAVTPLLRPWHTRWGATDAETTAPMPGDDFVPGCQYRTTRAIAIRAQPHHVWPWLVQVGMGRAGFYSLDLLDNLARPAPSRSSRNIRTSLSGSGYRCHPHRRPSPRSPCTLSSRSGCWCGPNPTAPGCGN